MLIISRNIKHVWRPLLDVVTNRHRLLKTILKFLLLVKQLGHLDLTLNRIFGELLLFISKLQYLLLRSFTLQVVVLHV